MENMTRIGSFDLIGSAFITARSELRKVLFCRCL